MTPILVFADSNESGGLRMKSLKAAIAKDSRFSFAGYKELPVDLQFQTAEDDIFLENDYENGKVNHIPFKRFKCLNVELKEPPDFVQSVLSGHLMEQVLSIREIAEPGCIVILGNLEAIYEAVRDSANGRGVKRSEVGHVIASTHARCKSFRKRSMLNGVPVFHMGDDSGFFDGPDQWADILELAVDYLTDGSLMGFRQRPADGERDLLAASILFHGDGIGPGVLKPVMEDYALRLVPRKDPARLPCDMPGIGPKRAAVIDQKISMVYGMT